MLPTHETLPRSFLLPASSAIARCGRLGVADRFPAAREGGAHYRFTATRMAKRIAHPRRSCVARIEWQGPDGRAVTSPHPVNPRYFGSPNTTARPEFPRDVETREDGSVLLSHETTAPAEAVTAVLQFHLRWAPGGAVRWTEIAFDPIETLTRRKVTLAAIHHDLSGSGRNSEQNRELLAPLVAEAADQGADLVVLPEFLTCKGVTSDYAAVAEPVPGPTTEFFGKLAKQHDCYLTGSIPERDRHLVYNTAFLVGPDGALVGKYRKVTLPREESQRGISPGHEYPVFETRFGRVGLMICYDVFFPEVARELTAAGAEIIALPIWGGNPRLAAARCAENGVYLVTSTYTNHDHDWMKTAIWNREGDRITEATEWGTVVTATVDLARPAVWYGLGDFASRVAREAPVRRAERADDTRTDHPPAAR